jgi:hypothetical protein
MSIVFSSYILLALCSHSALTLLSLCSQSAFSLLSVCSQFALTLLSLALTLLSLCSDLAPIHLNPTTLTPLYYYLPHTLSNFTNSYSSTTIVWLSFSLFSVYPLPLFLLTQENDTHDQRWRYSQTRCRQRKGKGLARFALSRETPKKTSRKKR